MSHQLLLLLTIKLLSVPIVILVVVVQSLVAGAGDLKKLWVSASPMLVSPVDLPVDREDLDRLVVLRDGRIRGEGRHWRHERGARQKPGDEKAAHVLFSCSRPYEAGGV